jgi:hypothetical protein
MGFGRVYPVYYEISFELETGYTLSKPIRERLGASLVTTRLKIYIRKWLFLNLVVNSAGTSID